MSKKALVEFLAKDTGLKKVDIVAVLDSLPKAIETQVKAEGRAVLSNVCSFTLIHKAARTGRNPQTGAPIQIAAKDVVKASVVGDLKKSV